MEQERRAVSRTDVVLTALLLALSVAQVLFIQPLGRGAVVDLLLTVVFVVPVLWRRVHPVSAAIVGTAAWWVPLEAFLFVGYVVAILLFYAVGRHGRPIAAAALTCVFALVCGTIGTILGPEEAIPGLLGSFLVVLAPFGFGLLISTQAAEAEAEFEAERESVRQRAADEERQRIVRELHDVVGHEVTLMSIQAEAATRALESDAPDRVAEPIAAIRDTAHRANRELRSILDLLGAGEHPRSADERGLTELIDRARSAGMSVTLDAMGEPWTGAPQHWLAINRIVQECLTNASKHASGSPVHVDLDWKADAVALRVANTAEKAVEHVGLGLPGMAERARLLGGTFDARVVDDEFVVTTHLPRGEKP